MNIDDLMSAAIWAIKQSKEPYNPQMMKDNLIEGAIKNINLCKLFLQKGYSLHDCPLELIEQYGSIENVPLNPKTS